MKNIILKNAFIVDPSQKINGLGSIIIKDKIIIDLILNKNITFDQNNFKVIDCKGHLLCPGFVDIKCHLRVPGDEHTVTGDNDVSTFGAGVLSTGRVW